MKYANEICFTRMCLLIGAVFQVAAWPMVLLIIVDLSSVLEMVNKKQTPIKCNVTTDSETWPNVFFLFAVNCPTREFLHIWRRHHYLWSTANFDLCSALIDIEQWGFFSVPHLLWHGSSDYNFYLRGPVKFKPITKRLAVERSQLVFTT